MRCATPRCQRLGRSEPESDDVLARNYHIHTPTDLTRQKFELLAHLIKDKDTILSNHDDIVDLNPGVRGEDSGVMAEDHKVSSPKPKNLDAS